MTQHDEEARLAALYRLNVLDTAPEEQFDKIVGLVQAVLGVPIATVTGSCADRRCSRGCRLGAGWRPGDVAA